MDKQFIKELTDELMEHLDVDDIDWESITEFVDDSVIHQGDRDDFLCFDVKNMGYCDWDKVTENAVKLGYPDFDAQDYGDDIYEICRLDNEQIFHDIEDHLDVPFYAIGRMGGHWGVNVGDILEKRLINVSLKNVEKFVEDYMKEYEDEYENEWDLDIYDLSDEIISEHPDMIEYSLDKDFIKDMNNAWDLIKKQSDYMLTDDYAEYVAEQITEDM